MMIPRLLASTLKAHLESFPAVALLGPRQSGKTTLARTLADARGGGAVYLDLEDPADRARLDDPVAYMSRHGDKLIVLDEIHRAPEIFQVLRGQIDARRRAGRASGHFLILGSAAPDLLRQSSESLAGRIAYLELTPLLPQELPGTGVGLDVLWSRGGFPSSLLASDDETSFAWRRAFIRSYLERDLAQFGYRVPSSTMERFWTMLAHTQGGLFNARRLGNSIDVNNQSAARYLEALADLLLVRRLSPWFVNHGKRLVKAPKIYVRDTGLLHALLGLRDLEAVLGHPVAGASWEGLVIETLLAAAADKAQGFFYRTHAGAEIDLVLEFSTTRRWAIEIKKSSAPSVGRGFTVACTDIDAERRLVVHKGKEGFVMRDGLEAMTLLDAVRAIATA